MRVIKLNSNERLKTLEYSQVRIFVRLPFSTNTFQLTDLLHSRLTRLHKQNRKRHRGTIPRCIRTAKYRKREKSAISHKRPVDLSFWSVHMECNGRQKGKCIYGKCIFPPVHPPCRPGAIGGSWPDLYLRSNLI